jgi:hypothetical protein
MSSIDLLQPILKDGIRSVNFFNGRLLSAEDLSQEQHANYEGRSRLGVAVGEGVADGLEVTRAAGSTPKVTVAAGLALNRAGQTLRLSEPTDVSLIRQSSLDDVTTAPGSNDFRDCQQLQGGVYVAGEGVYLLTIAPAEGREGRVSVSGLGNTAVTCNTRYTVEGVQFRLLQLNLTQADFSNQQRLRNRVAYKCFGASLVGTDILRQLPAQYGLLDAMRPNVLNDCDVPLALIYWTASGGVGFVDMWSVRRRLTERPAAGRWSLLVGDRRVSESEAMFLQFAEQVREFTASMTNVLFDPATTFFEYLPPVGMLPLGGYPGIPGGFYPFSFFQDRPVTYTTRSLGFLRSLLHDAAYHEPIDLGGPEPVHLFFSQEIPGMAIFASKSLAERFVPVIEVPTDGDLTGMTSLATVQKIRGIEVSNIAPMDKQVLRFDQSLNQYVPTSVSTGGGGSPPPPPPPVIVATGLVEKTEFALANVPGGTPTKNQNEPRATSFITHGLGAHPVAIIIGLEDFGELPNPPDFERKVDRFYAFRDTGVSTFAYHVVAEVVKLADGTYDGRFKLFTTVGSMQFFDRIRWWAIKQ